MKDEHLQILMEIQGELSTNTVTTQNLQTQIEGLDKKVTATNGKVRLHTKILLIVGTVVATLLITSGNEKIINIVKLFI